MTTVRACQAQTWSRRPSLRRTWGRLTRPPASPNACDQYGSGRTIGCALPSGTAASWATAGRKTMVRTCARASPASGSMTCSSTPTSGEAGSGAPSSAMCATGPLNGVPANSSGRRAPMRCRSTPHWASPAIRARIPSIPSSRSTSARQAATHGLEEQLPWSGSSAHSRHTTTPSCISRLSRSGMCRGDNPREPEGLPRSSEATSRRIGPGCTGRKPFSSAGRLLTLSLRASPSHWE